VKNGILICLILALAVPVLADVPATQPGGLDSLGDDALLGELASRGLDDLLNRAFEMDQVPPNRQAALLSMAKLQGLADPKIDPAQREQMLQDICGSIDQILPNLPADPALLVKDGRIIAEQGVDPNTGIVEYWGNSEAEKARLHPIADAAVKIFSRADDLATAQANDLANRLNGPDDKLAAQWQTANDLAGAAAYQKARMQYALALSMDAGDPARDALIDDTTKSFQLWDNSDSGIQPQVRLLLAKLDVLRGNVDGFTSAKTLLESLTHRPADQNATPDPNAVVPPPTPTLAFEARCFAVIANVEAKDVDGAQVALDDATADQKANFANAADQVVAIRLLQCRVLALKADLAAPGADHDQANTAAVAALNQLLTDYPGLRPVIMRQLAARLPANADLSTMDPLMLATMVDQARQMILAAGNGTIKDQAPLQHGLAAADEILRRYSAGSIPAAQAVEPSLLVGFIEEYLGDKPAAVNALVDHIQRFPSDPNAKDDVALERARVIISDLRQSSTDSGKVDPQVQRLEDRFLPIAINPPFNHLEFALQYAAILYTEEKWAEAVKYYQLVPDTEDPTRLLAARYGEMVALKNEMEDTPGLSSDQKMQLAEQIQSLSGTVKQIADNVIANGPTDADKQKARATLARMSLLAADITRQEQNDPQRVLDLLNGFEDSVQGLPDSQSLMNGALFLRVQAYMQLGRNNDATSALVKYLQAAGANEGAQTVHDLLETLNNDLDRARAAGDTAQIRQLADNRAMLSGFLVKWAAASDDPKIHGLTYIYSRFDADTKRLAATLETDPTQRARDLQAALDLYKQLQSPDNVAMYQAGIDPASGIDKNYPDPMVTLGIGLTAYELGDWQTVKSTLGQLVQDEKLAEDTDQYWEATYKLLDSMHKLAASGDPNTSDGNVAKSLKFLYLTWRDETGGKKWHDKFEQLRKGVIPDWPVPAASSEPS
jgi:hypothetical protein